MSENQYEIVFYGTLAQGFTKEQTQEHVAQLFKTTTDQVERMFSGSRVVIRNKLDQDTALKYIVAMRKRGAECQIEAMGSPGVKVDLSQPQAAPQQSASEEPAERIEASPMTAEAASSPAPSTSTERAAAATTPTSAPKPASAEQDGLQLAGDKVDEILAGRDFSLDPTGVRLSEERQEETLELPSIDALSLAPTGSVLVDEKEELPISVPDVSHLSIEPQKGE